MKVLVVHPSVELYGADKILLLVLGFLAEKHEVTLLLPKDGVLVEWVKRQIPSVVVRIEGQLPILHSKLRFAEILRLPWKLLRVNMMYTRHAFDLVYCNTLATSLLLYTRWAGKRLVHVHEMLENDRLNFCFSLLISLGAGKVVCVSSHVKERLLFSHCYSVLHNGIPDVAGNIERRTKGGKMRFVLPGRVMPQKGQWFLLDSLACLPESVLHEAEFHLFGSPPPLRPELLDELTARVERMGLKGMVCIHPFCTDIREIYSDADVVLVPSIMSDPFPTTVLEAMMFSMPVVTTSHGGASEIVRKEFGILMAPGDTAAFAAAIAFFIQNEQAILDMGKNARNAFDSNFTVSVFKEKFHSILNQFTEAF